MKLKVLGSSSASNGYILESEQEALIIECGCPLFAMEKALHFQVKKVVGCLVSHEHGDHAKYIEEYLRCLPVYTSAKTAAECEVISMPMLHKITALKPFKIGEFTILPFPVQHDAAEPFGFLINHPETGNILFATDTYYLRYTFENLHYLMIECNYDTRILMNNVEKGIIDKSVMSRVIKSHFSLENCKKALLANDLSEVKTIFLIHLSSNNSDRRYFPIEIAKTTGKSVIAVEKGFTYDFI